MPHHFLRELRGTFAGRAAAVAIEHRGECISYEQLDRLARQCAARLQEYGLQAGDRVVLLTGEKLPFLIAQLGTLYAGGVALPLNPRFTSEELRYFLSDSGARVAIVGHEQRAVVDNLRAGLPDLQAVLADQEVMTSSAGPFVEPQLDEEDPCLIMYSSGTTGWPKGVVHTHANVATSLRALARCWRVTPDDIVLNVLPLFHIHGLAFATHLTLLCGGRLLLEDAFEPQRTIELIGRSTVFMAVPTIYYRLLETPSLREAARGWRSVRLFTCGSAPIRPEVLPELEEVLGRPVINRYGMTEAYVITSLPLDGPWPQGAVGLPLEGVELRVVGEEDRSLAAGEVGSVQIRGPNLFREYWRKPEATQAAFASGWFETGDLGMQDAAGFLTLVGRKHDLIITHGYNVYPQVVERAINDCPGVRESAVVGAPDARRGERVVAFIVRDDPALDEARLSDFLSQRLVDYQRPRQVLFVDELPRNAMGKVLRRQLQDRLPEFKL
jgi:malonyl-CoA/methylmalonyl-CoA synthetase